MISSGAISAELGRLTRTLVLGGVAVIVHPDSLCGSLWTSGLTGCQAITDKLLAEVSDWQGPRVAVYGDNEEELDEYREVGDVIYDIADVVDGSPDSKGLAQAAKDILKLHPAGTLHRVLVTGAWANPEDGCVTTVAAELRKLAPDAIIDVSPLAPLYP